MRVLNFYRYLSLREIKNTFGIMDKDQKNDIRRLFMDKIVKRTKQVLLDLQSDSKLQKDIMKDQGKEYLNDCISKVQLLDMTIVLVYF
jgi:poly(3-hydroxyalkanoate) synthetase